MLFGCRLATRGRYTSSTSANVGVEEFWRIFAWHTGVCSRMAYGEEVTV